MVDGGAGLVGNGAEVPASEERPASRAKVALNMRAANRRLDEHGVRAQLATDSARELEPSNRAEKVVRGARCGQRSQYS